MNKNFGETMDLGGFSVSLSVKDLKVSKEFYEKLGFSPYAGELEHGYLIMKQGVNTIGLFQGMFEGNILTFNPGWDNFANPVEEYDDVRVLQQKLKADGVELLNEVDPESFSGPASFMFADPDGNVILIDQHV
jgi:catechol 2,3-dioxygenase-like lactoylglutathione lyase family enzyme